MIPPFFSSPLLIVLFFFKKKVLTFGFLGFDLQRTSLFSPTPSNFPNLASNLSSAFIFSKLHRSNYLGSTNVFHFTNNRRTQPLPRQSLSVFSIFSIVFSGLSADSSFSINIAGGWEFSIDCEGRGYSLVFRNNSAYNFG